MEKCILLILLCIFCGVFGSNPCDQYNSGNWCYETTGFVSCPSPTFRPCQSGLVCEQWDVGVVYCVRPTEIVATAAPTPASNIPAESTPTSAPSQPTTKPTSQPATPQPATPKPTSHPTSAPAQPTSAPAQPTTKPTSAPTPKPTPQPTTKPTSAPATVAPGSTNTNLGNWPNGPIKAIYIDNYCWTAGFNFTTLVDAGYNLIVLAFFVDEVAWDCTVAWGQMTHAEQIGTIDYAHSHGARIIASTGGSTDTPYDKATGLSYGQSVAQWVVNNNLDGMDFDLENFGMNFVYGSMTTAEVVQWVCDATNGARAILGNSRIITHAPQPPYFGAQFGWDNGYGQIYALCPTIDFFLVQFYNNGPTTTYETIFVANSNGASVTQMIALGIPMQKIVVGKPVHTNDIGDDTQGYNTAAELNSIFAQAHSSIGWNTGVMGWQWTDVTSNKAWINTIYP